MKHTLKTQSVFADGRLYLPGEEVDLPEEMLESLGELEPENLEVATDSGGADQQEELTKLQDLLKRTADAVLARQAFLRVPRATEQSPNGQDVAEAVALGFDELKAELDQAASRANTAEAELQTMTGYRDLAAKDANERQTRITELQGQLAAAQAPVSVKLPEDTLTRIKGVKGVGDVLADSILAALTEPAATEPQQ